MIDKFATFTIFIVIPAIAGNFGLSEQKNNTTVTTGAETVNSAEAAEPPSTTPTSALDLTKKEDIKKYIIQVFGDDANIAIAIATAESHLTSKRSNGANRNGTYDWGIFQVNDCHCKNIEGDCHARLLDPKFNIDFAKTIFDGRENWEAWSTYNNKAYKEHL